MDLKLSISILISSAYFLTLFLFKLLKSHDILSTLIESSTCGGVLFVILYALFTYISISLDNLKRKEANDAIAQIRKLEEEQLARKNIAIKNKFSEIDKAVIEKERLKKEAEESEDKDDEDAKELEDNNVDSSQTAIEFNSNDNTSDKKNEEQDIEQLKKEAGTQFDTNFTADNIQI